MNLVAYKNKLKTAGIPGKPVKFDDFDLRFYSETMKTEKTSKTYYQAAKEAREACKRFIENQQSGIALVGSAGRGKTFLAQCTAHTLLAKQRDLVFIVVPYLLAEIKDTYNNNSDRTELEVLEVARKVKYLFLDDLGAHNYTPWVETQLYTILNYRSDYNLQTFITSNLTIKQMEDNLGERITSRIRGMCEIHFIDSEKDIRTMKAPRKIKSEKLV